MQERREAVASHEEAANLVAGDLDPEDLVRLRVVEQARIDFLICERRQAVRQLDSADRSRLDLERE